MRSRRNILLAFAMLCLIASAVTTSHRLSQSGAHDAGDLSNPDVAAIVQSAKEFSEAYRTGDVKRLIDAYSSDVVYMYQEKPNRVGKEALEEMYRDFFSRYAAQMSVNLDEVEVHGDMAFDRANFRITALPKAGGEAVVIEGRVLEIFRKEGGQWKSLRVMVNNEK